MNQSFATSNLTVSTTPTISVNSGSICSGNSFTIIPSGANTYTLQGGNAVVSPTTNSTYTVIGTSTSGCMSQAFATSNITVTANPLPTIAVNSGSICSGQSFTITPSGANTYTFQGGSSIVSPTTNVSYTVIGTSSAGCLSSFPAISSITVNALPILNTSVTSTFICWGETATLNVVGALTYTWNPIIPMNGVVSPTITTSYSVIGTNSNNCTSAQVVITVSVNLCTGLSNSLVNQSKEVSIYPNPTTGNFTIDLNIPANVLIYNSLGQIVYNEKHQQGKTEFSLVDFSNGIYFIRIGNLARKIIKG